MEDMSDIYEMMMNETEHYDTAYKVGKREGREEGAEREKNEIAKAMLEDNFDINLISEITKLSIDEINALK